MLTVTLAFCGLRAVPISPGPLGEMMTIALLTLWNPPIALESTVCTASM